MRAPVEARFGAMPGTTLFDVPDSEALDYATLDAINTRRIFPLLHRQIQDNGFGPLSRLDHDVIHLGAHMMRTGMMIDLPHFSAFSTELGTRMVSLTHQMWGACKQNFNPDSPDDVSDLLFKTLHLPTQGRKWTKSHSRLQADDKALKDMIKLHPVVPLIIDYKKLSKLKGTFVDKLPLLVDENCRIHPSLRLTRVPSGRFCIAKGTFIEIARDVGKYHKGIPIEDVKAGDWAYCYDHNRQLALRKVKWAGCTGVQKVIRVHWSGTGKHTRGYLDLTENHEVRLVGGDYRKAKDLASGDRILSLSRTRTVNSYHKWREAQVKFGLEPRNHVVTKVEFLNREAEVYDIEVEDVHNFIANELCVHNSCFNPNLQQIPARSEIGMRVREGFLARIGFWYVTCDLSNIEVRVFAHECQDPVLIDTFVRGRDAHSQAASLLFGIPYDQFEGPDADKKIRKKYRTPAKNMVFLIIYGGSPSGLTAKMHEEGMLDWTDEDSNKFILEYYKLYKNARPWIDGVHAFCRRHGYVEDMFKRRVYITQIYSTNPKIAADGERLAQNTMIQGAAASIMKLAEKNAWEAIKYLWTQGWACDPVMPIHDELISEVEDGHEKEYCAIMQDCFENAYTLRVPIKAEPGYGRRWSHLK
jgi:DNA polymerase I-like protein with 3'-5' exonuclease and polymerase domains